MFKTMSKILLIAVAFSLIIAGCSRNSSNPVTAQDPSLEMPSMDYTTEGKDHEPLGVWSARFDLDSMTVSVEPNRDISMRLNVKPYLPNPQITINSWDAVNQLINVDIKITNPYNVQGFDLRLIIFTDSIGHTLTNDDGWTSLYDISGGLPINPFKAYAKDETNRIFAAYSHHTENLIIKLPGMNPNVKFAIDVSSPLNSPEPYQIANFQQLMLPDEINGTAEVSFTVSRWNPTTSVSAWIGCPEVFGSNIIPIPTSDNYYFEGIVTNYTGAPEGEYTATIIAKTNLSPLYLYDMVTLLVAIYPGTGWAVQFDDGMLRKVAADSSGNAYCSGYEIGDLMKYNDEPSQEWSRNIKTDESYMMVNDLYFNEFLHVCGVYSQCTTNCGYNVSMFSSDNYKYFTKYDCAESLGGAGGTSVIGNDDGYTYMCSAYGDAFNIEIGYIFSSNTLLTKFDQDGDVIWNQQFAASSGMGNLAFSSIAFYGPELINATGCFHCSGGVGSVDFDPGPGEVIKSPMGYRDSFLVQYNASNGSYSKVITWGSTTPSLQYSVIAFSIVTDDYGNIYIQGVFTGEIDFDPGVGVVSRTSSGVYGEIFISKFDPDWNFINVVQIPILSSGNSLTGSFACDRMGNLYLAGDFEGTVDFDPGTNVEQRTAVGYTDIFLLKLSNNLEFQWVQTWGSVGYDFGYDVACNQSNGNIYFVGSFEGTIDADPGPDVYNLTPVSSPDSFLMKILPNGYWE